MSEDKSKNSIRGKVVLWVLILGIYFSFLPNRFATSSIIDFAKGEPNVSNDVFDLEGFSRIPVLRGGALNQSTVSLETSSVLRNKRTALDENGTKVPAINWFAEVCSILLKQTGSKHFLSITTRFSGYLENSQLMENFST